VTIADHMVVNAAFLIERAREAEFGAAIRLMDAEMGHRLLTKCVGPVAPTTLSTSPCVGRADRHGS